MTDLESPSGPSTTVAADTPEPTTVAPAAAAPEAAEPEAQEHAYTDQRGQSVVPVGVFLEAKRTAKAAEAKAKEAGERAEKLEEWAKQWSPYLTALSNQPELLQAALKGTKPSSAATDQPAGDPEAEQLAREMDLYTAQGTPDTARAQRMLALMDARVQKRVQAEVAPVKLSAEEARASTMRQRAYDYVERSGYADRRALDQVLTMIPANLQADESVMNLALIIARGLGPQGQGAPAPFAAPATRPPSISEPLMTEAPGRRTTLPTLSDVEARVARDRGISVDKWRKLADTSNPVLE